MKNKKRPIFLEITRKTFTVIVLILGIYMFSQMIIFSLFTKEYEEDLLINEYQGLYSLSKNVNSGVSEEGFFQFLRGSTGEESDEYIRIYNEDNIYYKTDSDIWEYIKIDYNYEDTTIRPTFVDFEPYMILTGRLLIDDETYIIQIVRENGIFDEIVEGYLPTLGFILFLGLLLSILGAIYVSRNFVNRLKKLITTMNDIKERGLHERAEISGFNDEVDQVNIVFNSMMDDLESAFEDQSRFVSDASHELKTPLTALQGHLNMIRRWGKNDKERLEKSLEVCLNEVERLKKIVNDMLLLSKAEKVEIDLSNINEIDPKIVINEIIQHYKILNPTIKYTIFIEDNLKMKIDANDLKQLLIIFIDNSIKYNNKENIEIEIKLEKINNKIKLTIEDNGMGIPKDELKNVMKRFYKVDKSRVKNNSFGLGLSIANRIIKNYKGEISIDSEVNKYTKIIIYM